MSHFLSHSCCAAVLCVKLYSPLKQGCQFYEFRRKKFNYLTKTQGERPAIHLSHLIPSSLNNMLLEIAFERSTECPIHLCHPTTTKQCS